VARTTSAIEALLARAIQAHRAGDVAEAARFYESVLRTDPRNGDALHLLGLVKSATGAIDQGIALIRQAVQAQPRFPAAFFNLGNLLKKQNRLPEAVTAYERATALQPDFPDAWCNLGGTLDELGRLPEAVTAFRRAIARQRDFSEAQRNLGIVLHKLGRFNEAATALRQTARLKPADATIPRQLGLVLRAQGHFAEAADAFLQATALEPDNASAWFNLGACRHCQGKLVEAVTAYQRCLEHHGASLQAIRSLANTLTAEARPEDVVSAKRNAVVIDAECVLAVEYLGSAWLAQGQIADGIAAWNEVAVMQKPHREPVATGAAASFSCKAHATTLETLRGLVLLQYSVLTAVRDASVTAYAPALFLQASGADEAEALRQLDLAFLKKARGPIEKFPRPRVAIPDLLPATAAQSPDSAQHRIVEPAHLFFLYAQHLISTQAHAEALECLRMAGRQGLHTRPFLFYQGLVAASLHHLDEAESLYAEGLATCLTEKASHASEIIPALPASRWTERDPSVFSALLRECLERLMAPGAALAPMIGSPRPTETGCASGATPDAHLPPPLLRVDGLNCLSEDVINHRNDFRLAREIYHRRDRLQREWRQACGISHPDTLILGHDWVRNIGHIAFLGHLIKMQQLQIAPWRHIILVAREAHVANLPYLDLWRPFITIVTDPVLVDRYTPLTLLCGFRFSTLFPFPGRPDLYNAELAAAVEDKWEEARREPLLALDAETKSAGRRSLESLGMPADAWFVCLHVRESGFHQLNDETRNATLPTYFKAIKTITDRGGWVVRIGDASMTPLPAMERVIDYPHTALKSPAMDVFLCAECRFIVGMHSGLSHMPYSFGRPSVMTNWLNTGSLPPYPRDGIYLPKLLRTLTDHHLLPLRDTLGEVWGARCYGKCDLKSHGVELVDNSEDDINDAVLEMLARLDGRLTADPANDERQDRLLAQLPQVPPRGVARLSASFLRAHQHLL
jgi:putative glycosyltransferase (TIGR04372 family)